MNSKLTGRGVLLWLVVFFGVIFATNFYFIFMSVKTFSGEDEEDPYMLGEKYNQTIAQRADQAKIGWHATIASHRLPSGQIEIAVNITSRDGVPETAAVLKGQLRHPADENRDRTLQFHQVRPGAYVVDLTGVTPGSWQVLVQNSGAIPFLASRRIWAS
jgi:nitrogen fixation protein FixH